MARRWYGDDGGGEGRSHQQDPNLGAVAYLPPMFLSHHQRVRDQCPPHAPTLTGVRAQDGSINQWECTEPPLGADEKKAHQSVFLLCLSRLASLSDPSRWVLPYCCCCSSTAHVGGVGGRVFLLFRIFQAAAERPIARCLPSIRPPHWEGWCGRRATPSLASMHSGGQLAWGPAVAPGNMHRGRRFLDRQAALVLLPR